MSETMERKIDELLGFPEFDPHGHPIPAANGVLPSAYTEHEWSPLSSMQTGQTGDFMMINDQSESFLKYLDKLDLRPGTRIKVNDIIEFDQSMEIEFNDKSIFISGRMADKIMVSALNID